MNANIQTAIVSLNATNPAMVGPFTTILQTQGEAAAMQFLNSLGTQAAAVQPQPFMMPGMMQMMQKPTSYEHGNRVVVPFDGIVVEAAIIGKDLNTDFSPRTDWYVVLLSTFTVDGKTHEDMLSSYPAEMIWPSNDWGRMACTQRATEEVAKQEQKASNKAHHRLEILAGFPYTEEALKAMPQSDKVIALGLLGLNTFELKGDRVPHIMAAQGPYLKTAEGKRAVAEAKATTMLKANPPKAAATTPKVVAAPPKKVAAPQPKAVATPKVVAAPAKVAAPAVKKVVAAPPVIRKGAAVRK